MSQSPSLRKAAVLVASLDADSADLLLAQMTDEQADQVRRAVLELGEPDAAEQRTVLDEFFRIGPLTPAAEIEEHLQAGLTPDIDQYVSSESEKGSVRLAATQRAEARKPFRPGQNDPLPTPYESAAWGQRFSSFADRHSHPPFSVLHDAPPETLVSFLEREHPQAIALVLAHLPPERAGHILARLPASMQTDVIRRLVDLEETDPHVLHDVELAIESWFNKRHPTRRRMAGVAAVSAILTASEGTARRQILNNLTVHNRPLAHRLTPPSPPPRKFSFLELCRWPAESLAEVVLEADRRTAALALAGTSADLVANLLDCLEPDEADSLSRRLTNLGPLRLAEIDRAQDELAALAGRLHAEGRLSEFPQSHLTAVV